MTNRNEMRRSKGMTTRTAACGILLTITLTTLLVMAGMRIEAGDNSVTSIIMVLAPAIMLLIALFSAWNTGLASALPTDPADMDRTAPGSDRGRPEEPVAA